jgi:hypothetical protein
VRAFQGAHNQQLALYPLHCRPFVAGLCEGVEQGMADMRAGGKRIIKVQMEIKGHCKPALQTLLSVVEQQWFDA